MKNIIRLVSRSLGRTLYVRLRRNEVKVRHVETGRETTLDGGGGFSSARLLVAQSTRVTRLIKDGMHAVLPALGIAPTVVLNPLEMVEGGLSEVEEDSLTEIGYALGARQVLVITGPELSDEQVLAAAAHRFLRKSA